MSYEEYFADLPMAYENDERQMKLTFVLLGFAATVFSALVIWSVLTA